MVVSALRANRETLPSETPLLLAVECMCVCTSACVHARMHVCACVRVLRVYICVCVLFLGFVFLRQGIMYLKVALELAV